MKPLTRDAFISLCDRKEKLVRNEVGYSQQKMSEVLGLSKKTLVEIEKWRSSLGWQGAVTLCTLFRNTREITLTFGPDVEEFIRALIKEEGLRPPFESPHAVWHPLLSHGEYRIEQNTAGQIYRLRKGDQTLATSFDLAELRERIPNE